MNVLFQFGEIDHHNAFILEFMIHSFFPPCLTCPNPKVWFSLKLKTAHGRHFLWSHDLALLPHIHTFFWNPTQDPILYRQLPTDPSEWLAIYHRVQLFLLI